MRPRLSCQFLGQFPSWQADIVVGLSFLLGRDLDMILGEYNVTGDLKAAGVVANSEVEQVTEE